MSGQKEIFLQRMHELLGEAYTRFAACYDKPAYRGLRVNTLACTPENFQEISPFFISPVPFCPEGFYLLEEENGVGNHPYHHAGVFYIQEPSAMSAVSVLDPQPGDKVLDLCAAPGGKSSQIAARLQRKGLLVSNEYVASRARILLSNIERMGIPNAVVLNMHPEKLCMHLAGFFDKVLVDAPCSGEGMFRKDPHALDEWSPAHVESCAQRQAAILESAKHALREGGILVYSTCTFSKEENERIICDFLSRNPDFSILSTPLSFGTDSRPEWWNPETEFVPYGMHRIFPFDGGEGHFVVRLIKHGSASTAAGGFRMPVRQDLSIFYRFWEDVAGGECPEFVYLRDDCVYILPDGLPDLSGLNVLRAGILAGRMQKGRFMPEHQFYKTVSVCDEKILELSLEDPRTEAFLFG
ncbi:MAG TPA: RsmF rRNA methyltransferase first C-terminal domain-containing protein, partial [Firmicutes bacterium]|nr:RsmF rRNA methyltransferase first C-terminal domain-containing protein [Bacillota bacterium]